VTQRGQPTSAGAFPKGVAKPAIRALGAAGFTSLDQLANASEKRLAALHGMGPKALEILRRALEERGKSLLP
jgi:Helix-hairpin-helix domain